MNESDCKKVVFIGTAGYQYQGNDVYDAHPVDGCNIKEDITVTGTFLSFVQTNRNINGRVVYERR